MLVEFDSFEHQEQADLTYGDQLVACEKLTEKDTTFTDHSIKKEWTPDED